jgi:hypothetical protein
MGAIFSSLVPEFIDSVFVKTRPIRLFSVNQNERFGLVFATTGPSNSGTGSGYTDPDPGNPTR